MSSLKPSIASRGPHLKERHCPFDLLTTILAAVNCANDWHVVNNDNAEKCFKATGTKRAITKDFSK